MSGKRVIIGAGLAGLGAGLGLLYRGESDFVILERQNRVGGLASSIAVGAWTFDRTGHFLHFRDSYIHGFMSSIVELERLTRRAAVAFRGRFVPYPFQQNLWALEPEDAIDMLLGAIDAYYNLIPVKTFKDWILASVGRIMGEAFMLPYNRKLYGIDLDCLAPEQGGAYIPKPDLKEIVRGALIPTENVGYNSTFFYPKSGGIQTVVNALASVIADQILLEHEVVGIDVTSREVHCRSGDRFKYDPPLISTVPLPILMTLIKASEKSSVELLERAQDLAQSFKATRILSINIGIKSDVALPYQWIYVPDENLPFYRIGCYSNVSRSCCPDGYSSVWAEINVGTDPTKPIENISVFIDKTLKGIVSLGLLPSESSVEITHIDDIWPGYVLFQPGDKEKIGEIHKLLSRMGVISIGRYGKWAYMSMEESFKDGFEAVGLCSRDLPKLSRYLRKKERRLDE